MTNADLAKIVDTTDEWIVERSGIRSRHIADNDELTSTLGIGAGHQALVRAGIDPVDIDLVICATATPDRTFPSTAVRIQAGLGITCQVPTVTSFSTMIKKSARPSRTMLFMCV